MISQQLAIKTIKARKKAQENDSLIYQEKRKKFLDFLISIAEYSQSSKVTEGFIFPKVIYGSPIETNEIYEIEDETIKTTPEPYNYFNPLHNTRTKINSETCLETDKLEINRTVSLMCEIILSLVRNSFHFAVFYAEGQKSPHIRIYDLDELEDLNPQQRIKAQIDFWRKHVPFGTFHYFDTGMFIDGHTMALEFAPHWKYGTIFDLLFEWIPYEDKLEMKGGLQDEN